MVTEGTLSFYLIPVDDLKSAESFYRDTLGLEQSWREGDLTVAFKVPGTQVELMVDQIVEGGPAVAGPIFIIPSVDEFYKAQQGRMQFLGEPTDIPDGRWASATDGSGNGIYFIDQSKAQS